MCLIACSAGHFGPFCTQTCSCPANHICDQFTGDCVCENGDDCQQGMDANRFSYELTSWLQDLNDWLERCVITLAYFFSALVTFKFRVIWTIRQCYGSSSSQWKGVLGRHHWHGCTCHLGCFAAGSAVALPSQTEGQREQHPNRLLFHQPYCQLWICYSR